MFIILDLSPISPVETPMLTYTSGTLVIEVHRSGVGVGVGGWWVGGSLNVK